MNAPSIAKQVLPNGLTLLTKTSQANGITAITAVTGIGSIYETDAQAGLSNLTQTLVLKGTSSRTAEQIAVEMASTGARISTAASQDYGITSYISTSEGLENSLPVLFDILRCPSFPQEEVVHEISQTLQKIKAKEDNHLQKSMELLAETYYGRHPYHKSLLGYPETVSNLTRESVSEFYKSYYRSNNTVISAVGNFDRTWLVDAIAENLGSVGFGPIPDGNGTELEPIIEPRLKVEGRESQVTWLAMGFGAPSVTHSDYPAMKVLDAVIGGSMDCRLFQELRDKQGLAYQVGSAYIARTGPSIFVAYIGTGPDKFDSARDGILCQMQRLCEEPVTRDELNNSKTYLKGTFIMGQERNSNQAALLARFESVGLGHEFVDRYSELIDSVTSDDILRVAQTYLGQSYALGAVVPKSAEGTSR